MRDLKFPFNGPAHEGHFKSIREAAKFYKVQANTISVWIRKSKPGFTYIEAT